MQRARKRSDTRITREADTVRHTEPMLRANSVHGSQHRQRSTSRVEDAHRAPRLTRQLDLCAPAHIHQIANDEAEALARCPALLRVEEVERHAEDEEVSEERVEVRFEAEVNDVVEVGMVQMSEDAKKLRR